MNPDGMAIFGAAGAIGRALGAELEARGVDFRAVGRTRAHLEAAFGGMRHAGIFPADLADAESARAAARDVRTIVYAVGVPYTAFDLHPKLMRTAIDAAAAEKVERLLVVSSVYSYGVPQTQRVAETHPREPVAVKGRLRKQQEDLALAAHRDGRLKALVVRLPDFYGPHANLSLANPIFRDALAGKTATWLGPASTPHEFLYVPDAAPVLAELAARDDCYGEAWNLGGPGAITAGEFIQRIYLAVGRAPKFRTVGRTVLRVMGWFNGLMRELPEMLYLQETPVLLNDDKLLAKLGGVKKTSYDDGIRKTLDWMRVG